ncbi:MAG: fibronectin type III domain-containing protein [Solirubrobacterales bacterium]|nr:fibronectin type III domain-containing protein [Solirubrobacterales bacterium]
MRRMRTAAVIVLVGCGLLALAIMSTGRPAPASAASAPPSAMTGPASGIGQSSATVSGTVNPNGQTTHYYFRYGTTSSYGTQTGPASAGSGSTEVGVHATLTGLNANTTYHYQLVAQSSAGTTTGADQTLTTSSTTTSQTVVLGHEGFVSPGLIVGAEVGCFHGTTPCNGHLTMSTNGTVIAQRDYSIAPDSGGFQNMELNSVGEKALGSNGVFHLLPVTITAAQSGGQTTSWVIHLARWVWH